ncbi:MAG TPA: FkbM family methyltransferase [Acetobacteraceae bacterium]|nr:FkbM family methyltransferase [Acetobacteraceae bacterium]
MPTDPSPEAAPLTPVFSLVPGAAPIELVAYYPGFTDYYPEAELQTKRWLVRNARPDWVALDVGANVGVYTLLLSRLLTEGWVHAFEPTETAGLLRRNLAAQRAGNVAVHEVALGACSGTIEEPIYRIWGAPETRAYTFITLDDFADAVGLARLDCVKIDVDGFDLEVLKGAAETLARFDPWVIVELNHALATRGQSVGEALLWLAGQGYTEALVLDEENLLLRGATSAEAVPGVLRLSFDREPILLPPAFIGGAPLPGFFAPAPVLHNGATQEGAAILAPGPRWNYAASWPAQGAPKPGPIVAEAEVEVAAGAIGIGCLAVDMSSFVGKEVTLTAAPGPQIARLFVAEAADVHHLVLRNVDPAGAPSRATMRALRVARARPAAATVPGVLDHHTRDFALDRVLDPDALERPGRTIRIVPVETLGKALGFRAPYVPERLLYRYGLEDFKTEVDEPGIYRYLYRHLVPRRHLEFGTWEGFGTVLCAASCGAEIWTVNLAEGERDAQGAPRYASQGLTGGAEATAGGAGDSGERIGWRYRAAGYAARVHQLLCDSRDFPAGEFARGFFDTVLVDGGHTSDVVANDTDKALPLLRSGGVMIWHDFCPVSTVLATSEAGRGVMRAWVAHHDRWRPHLTELFWVRPSWMLIGVKA